MRDIPPDTPTISACVELFVFSFCLEDAAYIIPFPVLMHSHVLLFISSYTANDASTHHSITPELLMDRSSGRNLALSKYSMARASFF